MIVGAAFGALFILITGIVVGSVGSSGAKPSPTVTVTAKPADEPKTKPADEPKPKSADRPKAKAAPSIPGDGTYTVGQDIEPGTYRTSGPADSTFPNCYWARLKDTSGDLDAILANSNVKGQTTVTIRSGDGAFETNGCEKWSKVG